AVTYDGKVFDMYLDGKLQGDYQIKAPGKLALAGPFYVGSRHTGLGEDYLGLVDELAVYSGVLEEKKIKEIIENGVQGQFAVDAKRKLASTWGKLKSQF
ncbi:MAG: LamG-like jellyroll fold domain-containing protein, partial [Candidatus Poribacteria bacterium]|nr:LamG-like jellyroll fold domain-containing protein [Candidatus Poribacteria bacterium]